MGKNVILHMQCCQSASSSLSSFSRARSSLLSSASSSSVEIRCFQNLQFCLGRPQLLYGDLLKTVLSVSNDRTGGDEFRSVVVDRSIRCRVLRDKATEFISEGDKQSLPKTLQWRPGEPHLTGVGTFLPCDDHAEERYGGNTLHPCSDNADRNEAFRSNSSDVSSFDADEEEDSGASCSHRIPPPLHSRVEMLEGIPVSHWLLTFVESISPRLRGIIMLNMLTFLYGSNIAVVKETEAMLDPATFSVGRFAIAAVVFSPFLKDAIKQPGVAKAGLELGMLSSIAYLTQALGLMTTNAGRASFLTTFTVIVVPFFARLMGKNIPMLTWFAAVVALFGVGLLETSGVPPSVGDAWNLASAVIFGVHMLRTEFHSRSLSRSDALPIIALQLAVITASSFMWSFWSHVTAGDVFPNLATLDWPGLYHTMIELPWFPMLYTGLFSTAFCLSAELVAMRDVSATEAAVISTLEPLWGAAFAWFLLGERWGLRGWIGATFILGGSLVTQIWGSPEAPVKMVKTPQPRVELENSERTPVIIRPLANELCERDSIKKQRSAFQRRK